MDINQIEDVIGQDHLVGKNGVITKILKKNTMTSFILFGPPGVGKTTIANIVAKQIDGMKISLNAATSTKKELQEATTLSKMQVVILIIDEIHRLDRVKQDFLLPYLETDNFFIIGTTTENPYYDVSSAIRSRTLLFELTKVSQDAIKENIQKKFKDSKFEINEQTIDQIVKITNGDVRQSLNLTNFLQNNYQDNEIDSNLLSELFPNNVVHDKTGDAHHNLLSALQKSIRASDVNASIHYASRILLVGDFKSLWRRLIIIGYEDISNANPNLCMRVVTASDAFLKVGMPEGRIIVATIVVDLALSPKTNAPYKALDLAIDDLKMKNITTVHESIKYNQSDQNKYTPEEAKRLNLLPNEIKSAKYYTSNNASQYETGLYQNYQAHEKIKRR